ncbi:MAG TPA: HAMP domain-containing sensor histidine kinase [Polyangia bacterium]|nr:HAMP domain-containing sensor histidine kinase [Polyangia bacterium]
MTDRDPSSTSPRDETVALAAAAHEIKNALGPLGMTLQLAERQLLVGQPIAPADLAFARAQVRRLGSLVNDLLDLTRADLGEIPFRPCPADLRGVLTEAVEVFRRGGVAAAVALELPDAPLVAAVDAGRLLQVLINLLENAARYSPRGSRIVVGAARVGAAARIEVRDQGPGIGPGDRDRIFGRFVRGAAAEGTSGLGIGLYLCRAIVEQHGGTIGVDSPPGAGATFWTELPIV